MLRPAHHSVLPREPRRAKQVSEVARGVGRTRGYRGQAEGKGKGQKQELPVDHLLKSQDPLTTLQEKRVADLPLAGTPTPAPSRRGLMGLSRERSEGTGSRKCAGSSLGAAGVEPPSLLLFPPAHLRAPQETGGSPIWEVRPAPPHPPALHTSSTFVAFPPDMSTRLRDTGPGHKQALVSVSSSHPGFRSRGNTSASNNDPGSAT